MKIIVWNSQEKHVADYYKLMGGCDVLCLLGCGQWRIPKNALQTHGGLYQWKVEENAGSYDVFYCSEKLAVVCREGFCTGNSILYSVHSSLGPLVGISMYNNFWLFVNHETNVTNSYHVGEFYLREITDRFKKAVFIADFKEKSYAWTQETIGKMYHAVLPGNYHPLTVNYLFAIHVACKEQYLIEGFEECSNQPTFFELEI